MAVTIYKSTDASAPVLTGQVGSLVALLDACLVNGYPGKAAAGWTKPYTSANCASFRSSAVGGTGCYLNVDDNAANAILGARKARVRGYEVMTAYNTGTGGFPTSVQFANGLFVYKSTSADATARPWVILADQHTFTLFTDPGGGGGELNGWSTFHFGDIFSLKTGDAYRAVLIARTVEPAFVGGESGAEERMQDTAALSAACTGHYMPRSYNGATVQAIQIGKHCTDLAKRGLVPYLNPTDGSLALAQFGVHEPVGSQGVIRGRLRGLWDFLHDPMVRVNDGDTFAGSGALAGKNFYVLKPLGGIGTIRMLILETSDTWETSA